MLYPFHLFDGSISPGGVLQSLGIEWLLQDQVQPRTLQALRVFAANDPAFYQNNNETSPPNFLIVKDGIDWWFYSSGVSNLDHIIGVIAGGIGTTYNAGVLVHAFYEYVFQAYVKPALLAAVGTPDPAAKFHFSGHSYGGALAFRAAAHFAFTYDPTRVECITFGQPRLFTAQLPGPVFRYTRIANYLDPIPQLPTEGTIITHLLFNGVTPANLTWSHFGLGRGLNQNGTFFSFQNFTTPLNAPTVGVYLSDVHQHDYQVYWNGIKAFSASQFSLIGPWAEFVRIVEDKTPWPAGLDVLPPPPPATYLNADKINQIYFGGQPAVAPGGPFNFVIQDTSFGPLALNPVSLSSNFFPGGSSIMGLYQTEIHYAAFNNSWKERYCCNAAGTAQALKYGINDLAPFLSFRPPGTIITAMKASLITNPRLGDIKHLQTGFGTPTANNRRGVTNDCALVEMRFGGQKIGVRSYRGWQDNLIQFAADGTPTNVAAAQGALTIMAAALRTSPAWSVLGWVIKSNSPRNYYGIKSVTDNGDGTVMLTLAPADWAAVNWLDAGGQVLIQGPRNRDLPGMYGRFQVLASPSPNIQVRYQMIFGQPTWNKVGLSVRKYAALEQPFDSILFSDWRAHKTADPIELERGRGRKALTRR